MIGPHDNLYPTGATENYYFLDRGNDGRFYVHLHKSDTDEILASTTPYTYDGAQKEVDRLNKQYGYREPVDDDFSEEDEEF